MNFMNPNPGPQQHIEIVDVTDKTAPVTISTTTYPQSALAVQGWLTEDHRFFLLGDEFDEFDFGVPTTTHVFDVSDLDAPVHVFAYEAAFSTIDLKNYVLGNRVFQANFGAGMRVLEFGDLANRELMEIAFFDTQPFCNDLGGDRLTCRGAVDVHAYLPSGTILVSDIERGLFILSIQ